MQGRSLLGNDHRQFAFSELQFGSQTNPKIGYMLRSDSYKLLVYGSMQDCAFYDLKKDGNLYKAIHINEIEMVAMES